MKVAGKLQAALVCGLFAASTAVSAQTITLTFSDSSGSKTFSTSGTSLVLTSTEEAQAEAALGGMFDLTNFGVTALQNSSFGSLQTSGIINATGAGSFTITASYDGFTLPAPTATLSSSSSYSDLVHGTASSMTFQSSGGPPAGPDSTLDALLSFSPLASGLTPKSGSGSTSGVAFHQADGYSLTQVFDITLAGGDELQPTGTSMVTGAPVPEGGSGLMYLLLTAMALTGGMILKTRAA